MKILRLLLFLLFCLPCEASLTVTVNLTDVLGNPITNHTVIVQSFTLPAVNSSSILVSGFNTNTDNTGTFIMTNPAQNLLYVIKPVAPPVLQSFQIFIPPGISGATNASYLTVANATATFPAAAVAWSTGTSDLRYLSAALLAGYAFQTSNNLFTLTNNFTGTLQLGGTNITNFFGGGSGSQTPLTNNVNGAGQTISNATFSGIGSGLTGIKDSALSTNVPLLNGTNVFWTGTNIFANQTVISNSTVTILNSNGVVKTQFFPDGSMAFAGGTSGVDANGNFLGGFSANQLNSGTVSTNRLPAALIPIAGTGISISVAGLTPTISTVGAAPTGAASGDLTNNYPNPSLASIIASGTATKVTYDSKGRIISTNSLSNADLPASGVSAGIFTKGTVNAQGIITGTNALVNADLPTSPVSPGTATKVTVNAQGIVTGTNVLLDADIPVQELRTNGNGAALTTLNGTQITSGTITTNVLPSALVPLAGSGVSISVNGLTATISSTGGGSATNAIANLNGLGTNTAITSDATNTIPLSITGKASTKTNLVQVTDNAANPFFAIGAAGGLSVGTLNVPAGSNIYAASNIIAGGSITASNNAQINGLLSMLTGPGANLINATNSAGTVELSVTTNGALTTGTTATIGTSLTVNTSATFAGVNASVSSTGHFGSSGGSGASLDNFVAGNENNSLQSGADSSAITGGKLNTIFAGANNSVISGGALNNIGDSTNAANDSAIIGGIANNIYANSTASSIAGGLGNIIKPSTLFSFVAGGLSNTVGGGASFAGGEYANAANTNTFVWNDSLAPFSSSGTNQFLIHSSGGVGINTNNPQTYALNVHGTANIDSGLSDASLSANVPLLNKNNTWTGASNVFTTPTYFIATNLNVSGTSFENNTQITNNLQYLLNTNHNGYFLVEDANGNVRNTNNGSGLTNLDPGITRVSDFSAASDPVDAALHQWTNRLGAVYFPNTPANNFTGFTLTAPFATGFNSLISTLDIEGQNNGSSVWNWTGTNGVMLKYGVNNNTPVNLNNITLNGSGGTGTNFGYIQTSVNQGGLGPINWNNVTFNNLSVGAEIFNSGGFFYGENQWSCGIGMFFPTLSDNQVIDIRSIGSTNAGLVMEGKGNRVNYNGSGEQIGILIGKGGNADLQVSAEVPSNCVVGIGYPPGNTIFPKQTLATSGGHIDGIRIHDGYLLNGAVSNAASDNIPALVKLWDEPDLLSLVNMSIVGVTCIISRTNIADNTPMTFDGVSVSGGSNLVTFSDGTSISATVLGNPAITTANHLGVNLGDVEYLNSFLKYQRDTLGNIWIGGNYTTQKPFSGVNGDNPFASSNTISFRAGADNGFTVNSNGNVVIAFVGTRGHPSIVTQSGATTDLFYPTSTTDFGGDDIANWNNDGNNVVTAHGRFGTYPTNYAGNKTLGILDSTVIVKASGVAVITLPDATSHAKGAQYQVLNDGTTNMTLNTTSSQTIGNNITLTSMTLGPGQFMHVQGDTANWKEIGGNISTGGFTTINTNQFAVSSTGWTNSNAFDCIMYITSATAATFTYSDGTNTIFTDSGLTFTTSETLIMHPSYKVVVSSGTISGVAIVK